MDVLTNSMVQKSSQNPNRVLKKSPADELEDRFSQKNDRVVKKSPADELEDRLIDFAVRIIRLSASLPKTPAGRHIAGQILRCGTSPAPNYAEARGAESHSDFVHKLPIVLKELNETSVWLRIIERSRIIKLILLADLIQENKELSRIFAASLNTARVRAKMTNG